MHYPAALAAGLVIARMSVCKGFFLGCRFGIGIRRQIFGITQSLGNREPQQRKSEHCDSGEAKK